MKKISINRIVKTRIVIAACFLLFFLTITVAGAQQKTDYPSSGKSSTPFTSSTVKYLKDKLSKTPQAGSDSSANSSGFPVSAGGKEMFRLYYDIGVYSAKKRAEIASYKLNSIFEDSNSDLSLLTIENKKFSSFFIYKGETLFAITSEDSESVGLPVEEYARNCYRVIQLSYEEFRTEKELQREKQGAFLSLITITLTVLVLLFLNLLFGFLSNKFEVYRKHISSIKIGKAELLPGEKIASFALALITVVRWVAFIVIIYTSLTYILGLFGSTRSYGRQLGDLAVKYLADILKSIIGYLPNLLVIIIVGLVLKVAVDVSKIIFLEIEKGKIEIKGFYPEWIEPTGKIVIFLMVALAVSVVFPYLPGYNSPAFQGVSIFLGVIFSLGSSGIVSNIIAGFSLIYTRAFRIGDRVKIGEAVGDITDRTLLVTRIKTPKNVQISIPNSTVINSHVINYSEYARERQLILHTTVTIGYDVPWQTVHKLLIAAALESENILAEPKPFVLQTALNDFHVSYEINVYTELPNSIPAIYSSLHSKIQDKFNEAGVEIMSPGYTSLRDGNKTTIPENFLSTGYKTPGFRIRIGQEPPENNR